MTKKALKIIGMVLACVAGTMLFPYLLIILLLWSPIAWILGLIFPNRQFYPHQQDLAPHQ